MYPILLDWGPLVLPAWHTFYVLGAIAAFWMMGFLQRRYVPEVPESAIARIYVICYAAGYLGARSLSIVIEEPEVKTVGDFLFALTRFGAMTFYGGALASFFLGAAYVKWQKLPLASCIDIGMPAGLLALAIGRIGCFLNGDDYGKPVSWGIVFPNLKDGVARHPVQLYETALVAFLVLALVLGFSRLRRSFRPGAVGLFGAVAYANMRFGLEFLRDDFRGFAFGTWLSTSQFVSILVLIGSAATLPYWLKRDADAPRA